MKLRRITAIFCFLTAFGLSVFFVGLPVGKSRSFQAPCENKQTVAVKSKTELQDRIRQFLEADRETRPKYWEDLNKFRRDGFAYDQAEKLATQNLVKKMRNVECVQIPKAFCLAWDNHVKAWSKKEAVLSSANGRPLDEKSYSKLTEEIKRTYYQMLSVAEDFDVYFNY